VPDLKAIEQGLFFVVGAPRSGTTLVRAVLSAHPRIFVPPETKFFLWHEPPRSADAWPAYLERLLASEDWAIQALDTEASRRRIDATDHDAKSVFLTILSMHAEQTGKPRIGEKTTNHSRHVERLHVLFPAAKFIFVCRDPRDVIASQMGMPWQRWSHLDRARKCSKIMGEALRLERAMPAEIFTIVRYEALTRDPESEARRLCEFLGEDFDESMLRFHERPDTGINEREPDWITRTMRPISANSVGSYSRRLAPRQVAGIERVFGPLLEKLGYTADRSVGRYRLHWHVLDPVDRLRDALAHGRAWLTRRLHRSAG
jgi:hypothetical protein